MARNTASELRLFAERVEKRVIAANQKGSESMENLVCRLLTNKKNPAIQAKITEKWVEWKYGKATEHVKIDAHIEHEHFDASRLTDEQLAEAERIVESAVADGDPG